MLDGIRAHPIVAGAYTDGRGGICPMLAAHRHGGRVTLLAFSRAWDAFARTAACAAPRRASCACSRTCCCASLANEEYSDLAQAIAEHKAAIARRRARDPRAAAYRAAPIRSTSRSRCSGENGLVRNRSAPAS